MSATLVVRGWPVNAHSSNLTHFRETVSYLIARDWVVFDTVSGYPIRCEWVLRAGETRRLATSWRQGWRRSRRLRNDCGPVERVGRRPRTVARRKKSPLPGE